MKYRLLTKDELNELQPEFIHFLASNTITADDYKKLQNEHPEKVEELIEIFSDIVLEKVLKKVNYIEHREPSNLMTFHCLSDRMVLLGMSIKGNADLTDPDFIAAVNQKPGLLNELNLEVFKSEKMYTDEREKEIFKLLESGALISDGKLFQTLELIHFSKN
ncbi:MAG: DUF6495 family protein [Cytophagaceae bacterium]